MSYPPDIHLLRDLAIRGTRAASETTNTLQVTPGLRDHHGVRLGVLATLVDVSGAGVALREIAPDWIATADLQTHLVRPVSSGSIRLECRPMRIGARRVVVDALLRDDEGAVCGTGRMAFARIPGSATTASVDDINEPRPSSYELDGGRPIIESIIDVCGMELVGPGQLRFDKSAYVENSFGTVNGGVLALAAEVAAVSAAGGASTPELHARDLHIHYLEQIAAGPVAVSAEVVRHDRAGRLCAVEVRDHSTRTLVAAADVFVGEP